MPTDRERYLRDFERLRTELLDLSRRNPMLNYKHRAGSRQQIRIVDTTLGFAMSELLSRGPIPLRPLPERDDVPDDEKTTEFLAALGEAQAADIEYLTRLEALGSVARQEEAELEAVEIWLREKVREQLGLPARDDAKDISVVDHARRSNINPNFALNDSEARGRRLAHLQTLLFADELEARLSRIAADARLAEQEMGLSTLFLAFGFLRWFDGPTTEIPNFAPLLLLPVALKKERKNRQVIFTIEAEAEEPEINLSLRELLLRNSPDVPRTLPEFDSEEDDIESYLSKVREAIDGLQGWKIEHYLTLGQFAFGRLAMFSDLAAENWSTHPVDNEIVGNLLSGNAGGAVNYDRLMFAPDYDVDNEAVEDEAPILLSDADASQHSAIVDVMQGKNLVIEGPPGTGKSQTITNIIANALFRGKTVLFLADKQAALEVVENRLHSAGMGEFCLEIHSHKAQSKEVIEKLRLRCELSNANAVSAAWQNDLARLRSVRFQVGDYLKSLHGRENSDDTSAFELFWSAIASRRGLQAEFEAVRRADLSELWERDAKYLFELRDELSIYASTVSTFEGRHGSYASSPWRTTAVCVPPELEVEQCRDRIEELAAAASKLANQIRDAQSVIGMTVPLETPALQAWLSAAERLPVIRDGGIVHLVAESSPTTIEAFGGALRGLLNLSGQADHGLKRYHPTTLTEAVDLAERIGHSELSPTVSIQRAADFGSQAPKIAELLSEFTPLLATLQKSVAATLGSALAAAKAAKFFAAIPSHLHSYLSFNGDRKVLQQAADACSLLRSAKANLENTFDVRDDVWPRLEDIEDVLSLCESTFLSKIVARISGRARKAERILSSLGKELRSERVIDDLRQLKGYLQRLNNFVSGDAKNAAGRYWKALETPFEEIQAALALRDQFDVQLLKLDNVNGVLRKILWAGNANAIDAIGSYSARASELLEYEEILNEYPSTLSIDETLAKVATDSATLSELSDKLRNADLGAIEYPYSRLKNEASLKRKILDAEKAVEANPLCGILQQVSLLNENGCQALHEAAEILRSLQISGVSPHLRERLLGADGAIFSGLLNRWLATTSALVRDYEAKLALVSPLLPEITSRSGANSLAIVDGLTPLLPAFGSLPLWREAAQRRVNLSKRGLSEFLEAFEGVGLPIDRLAPTLDALVAHHRALRKRRAHKVLQEQSGISIESYRARFCEIDDKLRGQQRIALRRRLLEREPPLGSSAGPRKSWTDLQCLRDEFMRQRHAPIRSIMTRAGKAIQALKPCFMMSPLSLAKYLPAGAIEFDLLIVDEASQMRPEDALGGLLRARQIVIVGDPQQLPPTDFFSRVSPAAISGSDDGDDDDINAESILDWCLRTYSGPRRLKWHYRSRCESLIAFSNREFYNGSLVTFPTAKPEAFAVDLVRVEGNYRKSRNPLEARAIVDAALAFMKGNAGLPPERIRTLGLVAINSEQRELILEEFNRAARDPAVEGYLTACEAETAARGPEGFFIKNLENVQGDERDQIMVSLTYGPEIGQSEMPQRFGPINRAQGHRRLNVLFTRARQGITLFSSMGSSHIVSEGARRGVRVLHDYLRYAESRRLDVGNPTGKGFDSDFELEVFTRLSGHGFQLDAQVGVGGYRIDLGVKHPKQPSVYLAGIECDGAAFHSAKSSRDRDRIRESVLRGLGWKLIRIWSTDWFADPDSQTEALVKRLQALSAEPIVNETRD